MFGDLLWFNGGVVVGFVSVSVKIWIVVFWVMMPCSVVGGCQSLRRAYCLPEDGDDKFLQNIVYHTQDT
jgi:hypothetical protein